MTFGVVLRDGKNINITLSTIKYNKFGSQTRQPIIICSDWIDGLNQARSLGWNRCLFVDSGTVFVDWDEWVNVIDNYPHRGLVGHIIAKPDDQFTLHEQCWFMELDLFSQHDFSLAKWPVVEIEQSMKNLHDDYTPLWIKPLESRKAWRYPQSLAEKIMLIHLSNGKHVANWNNKAREIKKFVYDENQITEVRSWLKDYIQLAENQFWVLNNEEIFITKKHKLLCPGSGLFWIVNAVSESTSLIDIVDISKTQVNFATELWQNWNGDNYGLTAWDFLQRNKLSHFELDQPSMTPLNRLRMKSPNRFIEYVNERFENIMLSFGIVDFKSAWQKTKTRCKVSAQVGNLITWVRDHNHYDWVWTSNITDYKWTLLHSTKEDIQTFWRSIDEIQSKSPDGQT